uniref:Aldo/keto reductase n=1 Tax=Jahnella sp. MSr9139 TaxID=1434086 RepID=A0A3Q8I8X9_9BACT|nr:aldo/keto reductase [Jahnella sp. MSr9139]
MEQRRLGWTGIKVPVIGQGTWQMEGDPKEACVDAIQRGLDAGMTHVDTAEMYGSGRVEEIVGEAIAGRRDEVFLASKVLPHNASYQGTLEACTRSLRRLGTDRLDLYLLHWPGEHPLEETFRAFERLVEEGKIRFWGVSNFDDEALEQAVAVAGERRIACNQVLYHLRERSIEHRVIPACRRHDIAVVGYSPFGSGDFPPPGSRGGRVLGEIARERGATARQVALSFLCRAPDLFAIPKASRAKHALDNAAAGELRLGEDEIRRLEAAFTLGPDQGGLAVI